MDMVRVRVALCLVCCLVLMVIIVSPVSCALSCILAVSNLVKLSDAKRHASLSSSFVLKKSLHFGINEIISVQKLIGILDKMTVANLGRQHQRSLNSYFKNS